MATRPDCDKDCPANWQGRQVKKDTWYEACLDEENDVWEIWDHEKWKFCPYCGHVAKGRSDG